MNGTSIIWGAISFCLMLVAINILRYVAKYFDLPPLPKEHWIMFAFIAGMVFLKVFQQFTMGKKKYLEELKKQNEEDGYDKTKV